MKSRYHKVVGFTFIEVLVAMAIFVFLAYSMMNGFSFVGKHTQGASDISFATQKVAQMTAELRALLEKESEAKMLENYHDLSYQTILTTDKNITDPCNPLSGNCMKRYVRTIKVKGKTNDTTVRAVTIKIYLDSSKDVLAEATSIMRTSFSAMFGTVVYPAYVLAFPNVVGWARNELGGATGVLNKEFAAALNNFHESNPGANLSYKTVSNLAYGRDPFYRPYMNVSEESDNMTRDNAKVYIYPGRLPDISGQTRRYYNFMHGKHWSDGVKSSTGLHWLNMENELGDSMADQYNHAVRYPDEVRLFNQNNLTGSLTPTFRMILEGMNQNTQAFRQLTLINLHTNVMPMIPMRNYSDAAKDLDVDGGGNTIGWTHVRAVTHPENIDTNYPSDSVKLRVYTYYATNTVAGLDAISSLKTGDLLPQVNILIKHPGTSSADVITELSIEGRIQKLVGFSDDPYSWQNAVDSTVDGFDLESPTSESTLIRLYKSPLRHAEYVDPIIPTNVQGLDTNDRLYDLEYIPCLVTGTAFVPGTRDLTDATPNVPKNTARWTLELSGNVLSPNEITIETRIGADETTGTADNKPTNLSRTYVWVGQSAPFTEQYQFIGDPRHMPYADVKNNKGYNWYFGVNPNAYEYEGFVDGDGDAISKLWITNGESAETVFNPHRGVNIDFPRYFQVFRRGLQASRSTLINPESVLASKLSLGGEIGWREWSDPDSEYPLGLPINKFIWDNTAGDSDVTYAKEMTASGVGSTLIARYDNNWYGRYWLGELYPDEIYNTWSENGNLSVNTNHFYKAPFSLADPSEPGGGEPVLGVNYRVLAFKGAPYFFNGGGTSSTFLKHTAHPLEWGPSCEPCKEGNPTSELAQMISATHVPIHGDVIPLYGYGLELDYDDSLYYPMDMPNWDDPIYSDITQRTLLIPRQDYVLPTQNFGPQQSRPSSFITFSTTSHLSGDLVMGGAVLNSFATNDNIQGSMNVAILTSLLASFIASHPAGPMHNTIVPKVKFEEFVAGKVFHDPTVIPLGSTVSWVRWDDFPIYGMDYINPEPVEYSFMYSFDNGSTWTAVPGGWIEDPNSFVWDVSDANLYPAREYLLHVRAVRKNFSHEGYSVAFTRFRIERSIN